MITSKQNALVKEIASLQSKKYRDRLNLYVVEGVKMVKEAVVLSQAIKTVVCTEKGKQLLGDFPLEVQLVTEEVFNCITEEKTPQGVLAVIVKPETEVTVPMESCLFLQIFQFFRLFQDSICFVFLKVQLVFCFQFFIKRSFDIIYKRAVLIFINKNGNLA